MRRAAVTAAHGRRTGKSSPMRVFCRQWNSIRPRQHGRLDPGNQRNTEVAMTSCSKSTPRSSRHRPIQRGPILRALGALALGLAVLASGLMSGTGAAVADPGPQEQHKIEAQALESFRRIMTLWREEVYFELYDQGTAASKARITREDFAQRMVQLEWMPSGEINPRFLKSEYRFRTMVYIQAKVPYKNKFNVGDPFAKDQTLLLLLEDGQWRIDLIQLIRSPYSN
jgi:hypothetical protein